MDLSHYRTGSGPPLLLLHGLGMSKIVWRPVVPLLAREREVVALDLPGFGDSPPGPHTVEGLAHAVTAFAAELGLERPHVAGNSLGAGIALTMGAAGTASSVCALSPIGFMRGREETYGRSMLAATRRMARVIAPAVDRLAGSVVVRTALSSHVASRPWRVPAEDAAIWTRDCAGSTGFWDVLDGLGDWRAPVPSCPTTIAWGERDRLLIYSRQAPRARRALPDARHVVLRRCGHVPMWDDPDQVAAALLA